MLKDKDSIIRYAAIEALGNIGNKEAVLALIDALKDKDWYIPNPAADALVRIGPPAVPALIEVLKDKNRDIRLSVAETLGKIGDKEAVPALIEALKDKDRYVCQRLLTSPAPVCTGMP